MSSTINEINVITTCKLNRLFQFWKSHNSVHLNQTLQTFEIKIVYDFDGEGRNCFHDYAQNLINVRWLCGNCIFYEDVVDSNWYVEAYMIYSENKSGIFCQI